MRILGKGKTAKAIKELYPKAELYDDEDKSIYQLDSNEQTIVSPGIPPSNYLVKNTKNKSSDYDLFITKEKFSIWISGTNGKTTTTQMIDTLLKEFGFFCGGNIGTPLAKIKDKPKLILETSSFTLHYTNKAVPNIYVLLPISEDHISWHGTFQDYENSKLKPLSMMNKDHIAIIPKRYQHIKSQAKLYFYENSEVLAKQFGIDILKVNFKEPFLLDAILAMCVGKIVNGKLDYEKINSFKQDPHKLEEFEDKKQRVWVDDSKATNIDATIQALKAYKDKKIYLILGGDDKGADILDLFEELEKYDVEIFAIGSNSDKLLESSKRSTIKCTKCLDLEVAVLEISKRYIFKTQTIAILSPAAASLDQFSSYKQRGEVFKKSVLNLR